MRNLRHLECQRPCGCMLPIIALLALTWSPVNCLLLPSVSSVRAVPRIAPTQPHNAATILARRFELRMEEDWASADARLGAMAQKEAANIQAAATDRQTAVMFVCGILGSIVALLAMEKQTFADVGWSRGIHMNETTNTPAGTDTTIDVQYYEVHEGERGPEVLPGALCSASPVPASAEILWEPDSVGDSTADSIGDSVGDPPEIPSKADVSERKEEVSETSDYVEGDVGKFPKFLECWDQPAYELVSTGSSKTDLGTNPAPPALADRWVEIYIDNGAGGMSYWHNLDTHETVLRRPAAEGLNDPPAPEYGSTSATTDVGTNTAPPALADRWVEIYIDNGAGGMSYWHHLDTHETVLRRPAAEDLNDPPAPEYYD